MRIRITPACAGSTLTTTISRHIFRDHPRLRGEYNHKNFI